MADPSLRLKNPLEGRVGYLLRRASVVMMAELGERLAGLGLTIADASILVLIQANPGAIQTEIGQALAIKRANMVPLIAGLEASGLVRRQAADGRSFALHLTAQGEAAAARADSAMQAHEAHFLTALPAGQRRDLSEKLTAIWKKHEAA